MKNRIGNLITSKCLIIANRVFQALKVTKNQLIVMKRKLNIKNLLSGVFLNFVNYQRVRKKQNLGETLKEKT